MICEIICAAGFLCMSNLDIVHISSVCVHNNNKNNKFYSTEINTFCFILIQRVVDKLKSFREKVYPEDRDPVHLGDGYPNEQYFTAVLKQYEQTFI